MRTFHIPHSSESKLMKNVHTPQLELRARSGIRISPSVSYRRSAVTCEPMGLHLHSSKVMS